MRRFFCRCGQEIFFENTHCNNCGCLLGFDPEDQNMHSLEFTGEYWVSHHNPDKHYHTCSNRNAPVQCNWLIPLNDSNTQCQSCRTTRLIPTQAIAVNQKRWQILESAKRRMLYGLLSLHLPFLADKTVLKHPLLFDFLEDKRSNPNVVDEFVYSGHAQGVITLNAIEADSSYRESMREAMNEPYRTLLGHFRHEIGHYYWQELVEDTACHAEFRSLFGNESVHYQTSLEEYYVNGPVSGWQDAYISAYASSHPLEDWAETWAHYMNISETLEVAFQYELIPKRHSVEDFEGLVKEWMELVIVLNALNRSIGNTDAYPFVISPIVGNKLKFIHQLVKKQL